MYTYVLIVVLLHCLELNKLFVLENKSCELAGRFTLDDSVAEVPLTFIMSVSINEAFQNKHAVIFN